MNEKKNETPKKNWFFTKKQNTTEPKVQASPLNSNNPENTPKVTTLAKPEDFMKPRTQGNPRNNRPQRNRNNASRSPNRNPNRNPNTNIPANPIPQGRTPAHPDRRS